MAVYQHSYSAVSDEASIELLPLPASIPQSTRQADEYDHTPQDPEEALDLTQTASDSEEEVEETALQTQNISDNPGWTSFYFHRSYLLGSALLYCLMIGALEILHYFSQRNQGLATVSQDQHYLWTYGPSLVLTVVASYWGQLEYRIRLSMPWIVMGHGSAQPDHSILLDYMTTSSLGSLIESIKAAHVPVAIAISGSFMLRGLIIASTGLLSLQTQMMSRKANLTTFDRFTFGSESQAAAHDVVYDPDPANTLWAIYHFNSSFPTWTSEDYAIQSFGASDPLPNGTISAEVEVFSADLTDCEVFDWDYALPRDSDLGLVDEDFLDVWSQSCVVNNFSAILSSETSWGGGITNVTCTNSGSADEPYRVLIGLSFVGNTSTVFTLRKLSGVICRPSYSFAKRTVQIPAQGLQADGLAGFNVSDSAWENLTMNVSSDDLTFTLLKQQSALNVYNLYPSNTSNWFSFLNATAPQESMANFSDPTTLILTSRRIFRAFSALLMVPWQMTSEKGSMVGTSRHLVNRLCVEELSMRIMEVLLVLLALASVVLSLYLRSYSSHNPEYLATYAMVLLRSGDMARYLDAAGVLSKQSFIARFSGQTFTASQGSHIYVVLPQPVPVLTDSKITEEDAPGKKWWRPSGVSWPFRTATASIPLLAVIAIEVLYHYSWKHRGLASVDPNGYTRYLWLYIPGLVMTTIGIIFKTLDSAARLLGPFLELHKGTLSTKVMFNDHFNKVTALALVKAMTGGHYVITSTMVATLVGSILTIVTSGLYTPRLVPRIDVTPLTLHSWFDLAAASSSETDEAASMSSLIQYNNLSFPLWTFDEVVLPTFHAVDDARLDGPFRVRVPILRARMNCTVYDYYINRNLVQLGTYQISSGYSTESAGIGTSENMVVVVDPPAGCVVKDANGTIKHSVSLLSSEGAYAEEPYYFAGSATEVDSQQRPGDQCEFSDGRQHLWWMVGHQTQNITDELSLLYCAPYVEALYSDVTISLPGYSITTEPDLQENGPTLMMTSSSGALTTSVDNPGASVSGLDDFFIALTQGYQGVPLQELVGSGNTETLLVKMEHLYRQLVAQNIHFEYRSPISSDNSSGVPGLDDFLADALDPSFNGTVVDSTQYRLSQSVISTRILEVALLLMSICAVISWIFTPSKRILPRDPGSIAAKMSLFAGSELLEKLAEESAHVDNKRFKQILEGYTLSLGWWDVGEGKKRYGIDIGKAGDV